MRQRIIYSVAVVSIVTLTAVWSCTTFPDETYAILDSTREWARIIASRESYGFGSAEQRVPNNNVLPKSLLIRKGGESVLYTDTEGYHVFEAWVRSRAFGGQAHVSRDAADFLLPPQDCFTPDMQQKLSDALLNFEIMNSTRWHFDFRSRGRGLNTVRHGGVSFSAVGFDKRRTTAVLYAEYVCGPLCGGGAYYTLRKVDGVWADVVELEQCGWIS